MALRLRERPHYCPPIPRPQAENERTDECRLNRMQMNPRTEGSPQRYSRHLSDAAQLSSSAFPGPVSGARFRGPFRGPFPGPVSWVDLLGALRMRVAKSPDPPRANATRGTRYPEAGPAY